MGDRVRSCTGRLQQCDSPSRSTSTRTTSSWLPSSLARHEPVRGLHLLRRHTGQVWAPVAQLVRALLDARRLFAPTRTARSSSASARAPLGRALGPVPARHNPERRRGADRGPRQRAAGALLARRDACAFRRRPGCSRDRELEGLQSLQSVGQGRCVARVSPRSELKAGSRATFAVDTERLNFFDNDNGQHLGLKAGLWAPAPARRQDVNRAEVCQAR